MTFRLKYTSFFAFQKLPLVAIFLFFFNHKMELFSQSSGTKPTKEKLLVFQFEVSENIPEEKQFEIQKKIKTTIEETNLFLIQENNVVERIVEDYPEELRGCIDLECTIKIGRISENSKVIDGKIQKDGNGYILNFQFIDIANGKKEISEIIHFGDEDKTKNELKELSDKIKSFVLKIPQKKNLDKIQFVWRSAVLPGWGQYHNDRTTKAYLYGGIFSSLGFYYLYSYTQFKSAEKAYQSVIPIPSTSELDTYGINYLMLSEPKKNYQEAGTKLATSFYILSLFYLWNLFDSYYYAEEEQKKINIHLLYSIQKTDSNLGIQELDKQYGISIQTNY